MLAEMLETKHGSNIQRSTNLEPTTKSQYEGGKENIRRIWKWGLRREPQQNQGMIE